MPSAASSSTTTIYAVRHGETAWNCLGRYQGQLDIALNEAGLAQAEAMALALQHVPLAAIYSSDLARARHTALALGQRRGQSVQEHSGLREQHFGQFQGMDAGEIARRWPVAYQHWMRRDPDFGPEGGETRRAFQQRCLAALSELALAHRGASIAVICHSGVLDCLYRAAAGLGIEAPRQWPLENAAISRLVCSRANPRSFALLDWGDTRHLQHLQQRARDDLPEQFPAP